MYEINLIDFSDLTEAEKEVQPNNGCGKKYAIYVRIIHNGKTIAIHSDAMEPEDCFFGRDLNWIMDALKDAYEFGKRDAINRVVNGKPPTTL